MNTADMLIHVHPDLEARARDELQRSIEGHIGVDCAEFIHHPHPHTLMVRYDPEAIEGIEILDMVRRLDPEATRIGL